MAIVAKFAADFTDFNNEVGKASKQLDAFEKDAAVSSIALGDLGKASKGTATSASELSTAYKGFDSLLQASGINIGPAVKGIEELGMAAGKTTTQIGLLGTAGLTVGAAIAGWQIGRAIADFFGLDQAIANSTSTLFGWGDVAAQEAAAKAETLGKASEVAGRQITDMAEAVRVLTQAQKEGNAEAAKVLAARELERKQFLAAQQEIMIANQNHARVIEELGVLRAKAITRNLELGVSEQAIATAYGVSASQIAAVKWQMEQAAEAAKKLAAEQALVAAAIKEHWGGVGTVLDRVFGMDQLKKATTWVDAMNTMGVSVNNLRVNELEELEQTMLAGIDALTRSGQLTSSQSSEFARLAIEARAALEAMKPLIQVTEDLAAAQWEYVKSLDAELAASIKTRDEAAKTKAEAGADGRGAGMLPMQIVSSSGGVARDMYGSPVVAGGAISALPKLYMNFNITQPLGTAEQIANAVGNAVTGAYGTGGRRMPV